MRQFIDSFAQPTAADTTLAAAYTAGDPTITVTSTPPDVASKGAPFYIRIGSTLYDVTSILGTVWSVTRDTRTVLASHAIGANVFLDHTAADHEALRQLILLEQHTAAASAQLDFTSFISSSYDEHLIELVGIVPATDGASLLARMGYGGGPTYDSGSNYGWQYARVNTGGTVFGSGNASDTSIILVEGIKSTDCADGSYKLFRPQSTANNRRMMGDIVVVQNDSTFYRAMFGGQWKDTTNAMTAMRFLMSSGNIASGTIRIYGLTK